MIDFIKETFHRLIRELNLKTRRYLYPKLNLQSRLTGVLGARGVGKTTLMLQYIKNELYDEGKAFYFSADHIYFNETTLLEFVSTIYRDEGIEIFFIDEIHKYSNWNQELKNLYDSFPSMKIIFSGSSMMDLIQGSYDLSRRATLLHLNGMSFREYLNFVTERDYPVTSFDDPALSQIDRVQFHFKNYLKHGYYPFVFEDPHTYYEKIARIIDKTIYEDIANYYKLKTANLVYFRKILLFLASISPGEINTNNLATHLAIDHKTTQHYLAILEKVGLLRFIYPYEGGAQSIRKPQKIFLGNTSLLHGMQQYIGQEISKGMERELFFFQAMMDSGEELFYSKKGDFRTREALFEIGGKNKSFQQIKGADIPAYLVKDDLLFAKKGEIPLFCFGFLY